MQKGAVRFFRRKVLYQIDKKNQKERPFMYRYRKTDLGGTGREWSMMWSIIDSSLTGDGGPEAMGTLSFKAESSCEAMGTLLKFIQREFTRIHDKDRIFFFSGIALPDRSKDGGIVNAKEMIRLKDRFISGRAILRIKDASKAFIQGYGPETLRKLGF